MKQETRADKHENFLQHQLYQQLLPTARLLLSQACEIDDFLCRGSQHSCQRSIRWSKHHFLLQYLCIFTRWWLYVLIYGVMVKRAFLFLFNNGDSLQGWDREAGQAVRGFTEWSCCTAEIFCTAVTLLCSFFVHLVYLCRVLGSIFFFQNFLLGPRRHACRTALNRNKFTRTFFFARSRLMKAIVLNSASRIESHMLKGT